ncbi:hypothetical protein SteCoe_26669 [Stentor coeruleus]|uniref:DC-UbP/UBTD2 N-terminal domain-containing protein n=1 Tax=Stentor coeruleus TaxID=5963 RepID=A0A1R2BCC0_9CILI|nr:hypothetical protein SteCoe_26669 [Stentor coeruleus]
MPMTIFTSKTVGKGIKATQAWETSWTKAAVEKKRLLFWENRHEGNPQVWGHLRQIITEFNEQTLNELFKNIGLTVIKGLSLTQDSIGIMYNIPVYVINNPDNYGNITPEKISLDEVFLDVSGQGVNSMRIKMDANEAFGNLKYKIAESNGKAPQSVKLFLGEMNIEDWHTPDLLSLQNFAKILVKFSNK